MWSRQYRNGCGTNDTIRKKCALFYLWQSIRGDWFDNLYRILFHVYNAVRRHGRRGIFDTFVIRGCRVVFVVVGK